MTLSWQRLALAALGVVSLIGGAVFPIVGPYLIPAGTGFLGLALPTPGHSDVPKQTTP